MRLGTRISAAILFTSIFTLLVVLGTLLLLEWRDSKQQIRTELQAQSTSLGINLRGALAFADEESAQSTLSAMSAFPHIVQADVYLPDGSLLARYAENDALIFPPSSEPGMLERDAALSLYEPIVLDEDVLGHLHLRASLLPLRAALQDRLLIALLVLCLGAGVSIVFGLLFRRQVTGPIAQLVDVMKRIASVKDYSVRVPTARNDEMGEVARVFNSMLDEIAQRDENLEITVRDQTASIARDNKFIGKVLEAVPAILVVLDLEAEKVRSVSRLYYRITGQEEKPVSLSGVATQLSLSKSFTDRLRSGEAIEGELLPCEIGAKSYIFEVTFLPIEGSPEFLLELEDITERIAFQNELLVAKRRVETTLGSLTDGVMSTDPEGMITYLNPVSEVMLNRKSQDVIGKRCRDVLETYDINSDQLLEDPVEFFVRNNRVHPLQTRRIRSGLREGESRVVEFMTTALEGVKGGREGVVLVLRDVTEVRDLISKISHQATHDALTGLLNRDEFQRRLQFATTTAVSDEVQHALMYLDLDKFKIVNDTCGHAAGDALLTQLTALMRDAVRKNDTVARLGGDEFGILMLDCPPKKAQEVAETIREEIHDFRFQWEKEVFQVGVSIGLVALTPDTAKHESVLSLADSACYAAKEGGRNRIYVYDSEDEAFAERFGEVIWANKIARGLHSDQFFLEAQRITPLLNEPGQLEHYEILIRMRDEEGRPVPPGMFLSAAENYGLMHDLDAWVVGTVLDWCRRNPSALTRIGKLAINLSGHSITNREFHARIRDDIVASGVPGEQLCFEFTETAAISNFDAARSFIQELGSLGCTFSIDDFGTGMSSFAYLKNFPVHYLKIDGVFIKQIVESHIDQAMVRSINDVGHALEMETIAEFVENDEIKETLCDIGVNYAQGYGVHKPEALETLFSESDTPKRAVH